MGINIQNANNLVIKQIQIFDNNGTLVKSIVNQDNNIDISDLLSGIYFVKLVTDKGAYSQKIVKL